MLKRALLAVPAVVLVVAASLLAPAAGAAPATPGFHPAVLLPGSAGGTEPSLAISNSGVRYVSWQSPGKFAGAADGVNFEPLATPDPGASGDVTNAVSYSGALYNGQICGDVTILHSCIYRSLDGGHSWTTQNILADNHPGASDRPWIDVYPKKNTTPTASNPNRDIVYLEYHTFSPDDLVYVTVSHDGGATFSPPHVIESDTNADDSLCNTIPGGITVDQATGAVYALWLSGNDVESNVPTGGGTGRRRSRSTRRLGRSSSHGSRRVRRGSSTARTTARPRSSPTTRPASGTSGSRRSEGRRRGTRAEPMPRTRPRLSRRTR